MSVSITASASRKNRRGQNKSSQDCPRETIAISEHPAAPPTDSEEAKLLEALQENETCVDAFTWAPFTITGSFKVGTALLIKNHLPPSPPIYFCCPFIILQMYWKLKHSIKMMKITKKLSKK